MGNNIINVKNKPHAILFVESKLCDLDNFIKDYIKSIVFQHGSETWAKKIDNNEYYDIIKINGYENTIKKDEIVNIINRFSTTGVESIGLKFYIIRGIENATPQAVNSLLKFLEEPFANIFAILTTRSLNLVLPTIKSRVQTYILKTNTNRFNENIKKFRLNEQQIKVIKNIYYGYDEIVKDLENDRFCSIYEMVTSLIKNIDNITVVKHAQEQFSKLDYNQILLMLKIINSFLPNNIRLINLMETINNNPVKILIFNNI
jgi:DNA polymerase-3 subunit delta'